VKSKAIYIEFFGLPGAGKSTISEYLKDDLSQRFDVVDQSRFRSYLASINLFDKLRFSCNGLFDLLSDKQVMKLFFCSKSFQFGRLARLYIKSSLLKVCLSQMHANQILLLDQAIAQGIWSLFAFQSNLNPSARNLIHLLMSRLTISDLVIHVSAPIDCIAKRIVCRKHGKSRFDSSSTLHVERRLSNSLSSYYALIDAIPLSHTLKVNSLIAEPEKSSRILAKSIYDFFAFTPNPPLQ
jgi:cytidylate kinase